MKLIKAPDEFLEKQVKAFDFSTMDPGEISKNMIDVMPVSYTHLTLPTMRTV